MKNLINILLGLWLLASPVYAVGFQPLISGTTNTLADICFTDINTGYAIGSYGTIIKTTNAGLTWQLLYVNPSESFYKVYFVETLIGYVVGYNGVMLKTTNAGLNWLTSYPGPGYLSSVYFTNSQTGWVVGQYSSCLKTTNGGANWLSQTIPFSSENLRAITFNNGKGFIGVTTQSNLLTSTNEGVTWLDCRTRVGDIATTGICFSNFFGLMVGREAFANYEIKPIIFITNNNGQTWIEKVIANKKGMFYASAICPTNPNICYAVGEYHEDSICGNKGLILYSTTAGLSWQEEAWPTDPMVFYGVAATLNAVYIVGSDGLILKSALPIGIVSSGTEVPYKYDLSQNYPNPFNPTTNIEFAVPKSGNVKITVFDLAGKEITVLLSQFLSPGKYKVDFNAEGLSSGAYFYKLSAGDYSAVKKLVLLK